MSSECTLAGVPLVSLSLTIPASGIWHADAVLSSDVAPTSQRPTLSLYGTAYVCAVVRQTDWAGKRMVRLVGGAGGWRTELGPHQYASPLGVPASVVIQDAASAVGERPVLMTSNPTLGPGWARITGPASRVLQQIFHGAWYMTADGVVHTGDRLGGAIGSAFQVMMVDGETGRVLVATESPNDWLPGATFTSASASGTVNRVRHVVDGDTLRTEVMVA